MIINKNIEQFIREYRDMAGSNETAGEYLGVSGKSVANWLKGHRDVTKRALNTMSEATGYSIEEIQNWGAEEKTHDFITVPYWETEPTADDSDTWVISTKIKDFLAFNTHWIYSKGSPNNMGVMQVNGPSMEPTIFDGAVVLIDLSKFEPKRNHVYLVTYEGGPKIKRIDWDSDQYYILKSDNPEYNDKYIQPGDKFQILGKAIWTAHEIN